MVQSELDEFLQEQRKAAEERAARKRAEKLSLDYLDLISVSAPTEIKAMELIKEEDARRGKLVPVQLIRKKLIVAVFNPSLPEAVKLIKQLEKNYTVTVVIATESGLRHAWSYYQYVKETPKHVSGAVTIDPERIQQIQQDIQTLKNFTSALETFKNPQISRVLELVLGGAVALGASDIHLEPGKEANFVRIRIDGMLHIVSVNMSEKLYHALVSRIKLLSNLKLNIKDEAQDGRFTINLPKRDIEIRSSVIPSEYGETVVMRLLDPGALDVSLEKLGWRKDDLEIIKQETSKPNGLILNTGPTGSGKTTTLYAFLKQANKPEIKIITVEDPVEYHLDGVSQTQVDPDAGYTFASGLRSILRQDPDIILIGEIRDKETAGIALNASLTGHLVFSTLHTNDAVGAVPRLIDLGAKPNILGPALSVVIAQRLVRKLCPACKEAVGADTIKREVIDAFLNSLPKRVDRAPYKNPTIYKSVGCTECNNIGYKGRTSIFELFVISEPIEQAIYKSPTELELKELARTQGMVTMQEDGVLKIFQGITDIAEVERLTGSIVWTQTKNTSI
ncbi:MAG TPA: type II/IV secretion system protein [Candidatus Jorgensenbacteria bacterium]|uniref:Bacterial type II secretion system protein E domain-containing protein n=1 Tax=marine sediment metagenome TaxID=412755 RepID=A0A0F9HTE0_9ZZZZ|nr:type II/IV secretion system protein [Candidatus Jorgensenbacteria bacterium]